MFGSTPGLSSFNCSGICDAGYFCPPASSNGQAVSCGSVSVYCPSQSSQPLIVTPGYFSVLYASQSPCPIGFYCSGGIQIQCNSTSGVYCPNTTTITPLSIPSGYLSNDAISLIVCPAGYYCISGVINACGDTSLYCPRGSTKPTVVPLGYYTANSSAISICPSDFYCVNGQKNLCTLNVYCPQGSSFPQPVDNGYYVMNSTILVCSAGFYCINGFIHECGNVAVYCPQQSSSPLLVDIGYYGNFGNTTNTNQLPCLSGSYCIGGITDVCPRGSFSSLNFQTNCIPCSAGTYNTMDNLTSCSVCGYGFYQPFGGQTFCNMCPTQSYTIQNNSESCLFCTAGQYLNTSSCIDCVAGTYSNNNTCQSCFIGTFSSSNSASTCLQCPDGTFSYLPQSTSCSSCIGISGIDCTQGKITNQNGIWLLITENSDIVTVACPNGYCLSNSQCGPNRKPFTSNVLCGECDDGFTELNGNCVSCTKANIGIIFLILIVSWIYVFITHYLSNGTTKHRKRTGATTTFFYFVQMSYLESGPISGWLSWISFFNFAPNNAVGSDACILPLTPYSSFALNAFIPFLFFIQLSINGFIHKTLIYNGCASMFSHFQLKNYLRTALVLFLWCFTQVATTVIQFFRCINVQNTNYSIVASIPAIDCHSSEYSFWLAIAILLFILVVIVIPSVLFVGLYYYRTSNTFGVLYEPYKPQFWFWEIIVILGRRLIMISLYTGLSLQPSFMDLSFTWFHALTFIVQWKLSPFVEEFDNKTELISIGLLMLISSFFIVEQAPYSTSVQVIIFFMFPVPAAFFLLAIFSQKIRRIYERYTISIEPTVGTSIGTSIGTTVDTTVDPDTRKSSIAMIGQTVTTGSEIGNAI